MVKLFFTSALNRMQCFCTSEQNLILGRFLFDRMQNKPVKREIQTSIGFPESPNFPCGVIIRYHTIWNQQLCQERRAFQQATWSEAIEVGRTERLWRTIAKKIFATAEGWDSVRDDDDDDDDDNSNVAISGLSLITVGFWIVWCFT